MVYNIVMKLAMDAIKLLLALVESFLRATAKIAWKVANYISHLERNIRL